MMILALFAGLASKSFSLPFILGDFSLRNSFSVLFLWAVSVSYCALISFRQFESILFQGIPMLKSIDFAVFFLPISSVIFLAWRIRKINFALANDYEKPYKSCSTSFKFALSLHIISSFVVASPQCALFSREHWLTMFIGLLLSNWNCLPILIKTCLAVSTTDYSKFDRQQYVLKHTLNAYKFLFEMKNVMMDHFLKFYVLTMGTFLPVLELNSLCECLRLQLAVLILSNFTLFPVLICLRSNSEAHFLSTFRIGNAVNVVRGLGFPIEGPRRRTFSSSSSQTTVGYPQFPCLPCCGSNQFAFNIRLLVTTLLVVVDLFLWLIDLINNVISGKIWDKVYLKPTNLWALLVAVATFCSLACFLVHLLSKVGKCDVCQFGKSTRPRGRMNSDSFPPLHCSEQVLSQKALKLETNVHSDVTMKSVLSAAPKSSITGLVTELNDADVLQLICQGKLKTRDLETAVGSLTRAVYLRRQDLALRLASGSHAIDGIPYCNFDYRPVIGQCCEEVIGYVPIPLGKVGPLLLDGKEHYVPLATTEGCLIASTNRGCRALYLSGGVKTAVFRDQMTRAPVVAFPSVREVVECIAWLESKEGFACLRDSFNETSSHADLISVFPNPSGRHLHLRFAARTGEAMGMNMVSKGTDRALRVLSKHFPTMQVISLSGNMCTDKKPTAINSILGRGKSVLGEARLPNSVIRKIFRTDSAIMANLAQVKNWTGSAMAGSLGMAASNAHAANLVAALFASTGQDLAQVVNSSACLTQLELEPSGSLYVTVTMPCLEVGTIGGGTRLPTQHACLEMLDLSLERPAEHLARLLVGVVIAGELSLLAALATNDLVEAHMRLNRAAAATSSCSQPNGRDKETSLKLMKPDASASDDLTTPDAHLTFM